MRDLTHMGKLFDAPPLNLRDFDASPLVQFEQWLNKAIDQAVPEPNAMTLSTSDVNNQPNARVVLLKKFDESGFIFFGNYDSQKGQELAANPKACLSFWWGPLNRQIRILGAVSKEDKKLSSDYFHSRPLESQIAAIISPQSKVIQNKTTLTENYEAMLKQHHQNQTLPNCPDSWGGFKLVPNCFEFWQGGANRLHDRFVYHYDKLHSSWLITQLAP
jgi:pyridoxamine 5'-phosphate oxidase